MNRLAFVSLALALAACSPKTETPKPEAPHGDPAPPIDPHPAANAKRMAMPDCDGNGPGELKDCRIKATEAKILKRDATAYIIQCLEQGGFSPVSDDQ